MRYILLSRLHSVNGNPSGERRSNASGTPLQVAWNTAQFQAELNAPLAGRIDQGSHHFGIGGPVLSFFPIGKDSLIRIYGCGR
jgi:hypothetical protein